MAVMFALTVMLTLNLVSPCHQTTATCSSGVFKSPDTAATCITIEEVFYAPIITAKSRQWVDLKNRCESPVSLRGVEIRWSGDGLGYEHGTMQLSDRTVGPGECFTVGGPLSEHVNYNPPLDQIEAFEPPLFDPGFDPRAEGIGLFLVGDSVPFMSIIYGDENLLGLIGPSGKAEAPTIGRVNLSASMARAWYGWIEQDPPEPGTCH